MPLKNKSTWRWIAAMMLCWLTLASYAHQVEISQLHMARYAHSWRLVFTLSQGFQYQHFLLKHPPRLVIDIHQGHLEKPISETLLFNTPIKQVRSYYHAKQARLRLVFDFRRPLKIKVFALAKDAKHKSRLVIDLMKSSQANTALLSPMPLPIVQQKPTSYRDVMIVVDPGHGGKDPGAIGVGRTPEKKIVLAIATQLVEAINQQPGFKAVSTRRGDYYLGLRERLAIARKYKADMFVAIHADAYPDRNAHGASIYALSRRGATSEAARWLAKQENASELLGGVVLSDKNNLLKSVLINLSQTATIRTSLQIGYDILRFVGGIANLHHHRVDQAAFVVLKSPDIPSLLIETGFLSNPKEEYRLRNPNYRGLLAKSIMQGIRAYFKQRPPPDTRLAQWKEHPQQWPKRYVVSSGDTLVKIARKNQVSYQQLKSYNHLRSVELRIGQVLKIPAQHPS